MGVISSLCRRFKIKKVVAKARSCARGKKVKFIVKKSKLGVKRLRKVFRSFHSLSLRWILRSFHSLRMTYYSVILSGSRYIRRILSRFATCLPAGRDASTSSFDKLRTSLSMTHYPVILSESVLHTKNLVKRVFSALKRRVSLASARWMLPHQRWVSMTLRNYFKVPTQTKARYHLFGVTVASLALTVGLVIGGWNIYKAVFALTETTKTMPADIAFNRGVSGALASYLDDEGKIEVASNSVKLAKVGNWWNESYLYRKKITLKNLSSSSVSTSSAQITIDTQTLVAASKLQADCDDLRIAKQATAGGQQ